jgi:signal transduction histidine kinase
VKQFVRVIVGLVVVVVGVLFPARADAATRPAMHVTTGPVSKQQFAGIPVPMGENVYEQEVYAPSDCTDAMTESCDLIDLDLDLPPTSSTADVILESTLRWDDSSGNVLYFALFERLVALDGTPYYYRIRDGDTTTSPAKFQVVNPNQHQYVVRVLDYAKRNSGYTVEASLHAEPFSLPVDYSASPSSVQPKMSNSRTITTQLAGAPTGDPSFPLGAPLAVASRRATAASGGRSTGGPWWLLLGAALLVLAVVVAARRARGRNARLFWKLLTPFLVVILVGGIASAFLITRYLTSRASDQLDQDLLQRSITAASYFRDREAALVNAQRFAANTEGLPGAVAAGNEKDAATAMASSLAVNPDLDLLAAVDLHGVGVAEFTKRGDGYFQSSGSSFDNVGAVKTALASDTPTKSAALEMVNVGDETMLASAVPVQSDGVVGAMVAAMRLRVLASAAAHRANGAVALYDASGRRVAASSKLFAPEVPSNVHRGAEPVRQRRTVAHEGRATAYTSLDEGGHHIGTLAVDLPTAPAFAAVAGARTRLALILFAVMAAIVGLGTLVSRSVIERVNRLVQTNRALGAGDFSVRTPELGSDELGELATGFNQMAEQLEASYSEMERRVADRTEELQRLYQDLVRSNEARSDLFAAISHEFRTPVFAILAHAELMADAEHRPKGTKWLGEFSSTITDSAQILLGRVNDILELASLEHTELELDLRPLEFAKVVERIQPQVAALARQAGVDFSAEVPANLPRVCGDERRVEQVLMNLLSNAVKYNRDGGSVTMTAAASDGFVDLTVADTGVGIPSDIGDRVFEPFYRVEATPVRLASSGLGLALSKRLVEAQGGTIAFTSTPGEGSTFTVRLPAVSEPRTTGRSAAS